MAEYEFDRAMRALWAGGADVLPSGGPGRERRDPARRRPAGEEVLLVDLAVPTALDVAEESCGTVARVLLRVLAPD